ncbi:MAG: phospholipase C, phosphocholine-specific [Methylococcaceae bacterium]
MKSSDRRKFIQIMGSGTLAAALPLSISKALAISAHNRTGTIADVEHIVILTQENQSFDHYFGTLRGVRGFSDPRVAKLPNGRPVWFQPNTPDTFGLGVDELPPFRVKLPSLGMEYLPGTAHDWNSSHKAWNFGKYDQWVANKSPITMAYLKRDDIPYHFALADAFTICDAYHCSVMGPTDPNRYHMWTGWTGNDGLGGGPVLSNAEVGYDWMTYPERLQEAGVSWKVYQDIGMGLVAPNWGWENPNGYIGNYGDNSLLYFHQYQDAKPGTPLAVGAKTGTNIAAGGTQLNLFDMLREDVSSGKLPQVSWIASPEAYSEHANWPANFGAWYISQVLDILTSNPEVWSKTILFINWDENDGGFDHMVAPTPPQGNNDGKSTVSTVNEVYTDNGKGFISGPIGLGARVPLLAISPWSKGGYVNSQVFDHTSLIRFIEQRFGPEHPGLIEPNITPWRRAVAGDLTSIFNFANPNEHKAKLPGTADYLPPEANSDPKYNSGRPSYPLSPSNVLVGLPIQEPGIRPARALPYKFDVHGAASFSNKTFRINFGNIGRAAAVFQVRSGDASYLPRSYTVEAGKSLADAWKVDSSYDLSVYGPNGFLRAFKGNFAAGAARATSLDVGASYDSEERGGITLRITNTGKKTAEVTVLDAYTGVEFVQYLAPHEDMDRNWSLHDFHGWYDLIVRVTGDTAYECRLAGHVETGRDSTTDPAIGGLTLKD